jgi:hypothetical protein
MLESTVAYRTLPHRARGAFTVKTAGPPALSPPMSLITQHTSHTWGARPFLEPPIPLKHIDGVLHARLHEQPLLEELRGALLLRVGEGWAQLIRPTRVPPPNRRTPHTAAACQRGEDARNECEHRDAGAKDAGAGRRTSMVRQHLIHNRQSISTFDLPLLGLAVLAVSGGGGASGYSPSLSSPSSTSHPGGSSMRSMCRTAASSVVM